MRHAEATRSHPAILDGLNSKRMKGLEPPSLQSENAFFVQPSADERPKRRLLSDRVEVGVLHRDITEARRNPRAHDRPNSFQR
jgi:hypothetical protein